MDNTSINHAAARATILALANQAAAQWTGVDWDTAPSTVLAALQAGKLVDAREEQIQAGTFWGARDAGSNDAQRLTAAWRRLTARIAAATEVTDDLVEDAAELAEAERAEVASDAAAAAEMGRQAAALVGAGEWDDAVLAAREAAAIERAYGDTPAWGGLAAAIQELPEYLAIAGAAADYKDDDRDDDAIAAEVDAIAAGRRVCESLEDLVNAGEGVARTAPGGEEWGARYVASWCAEMREWCAA